MTRKHLLTLSTSGVVTNPKHLIRRIFLNYFRMNVKTGRLYRNELVGIEEVLKNYKNDLEGLTEQITKDLTKVINRYLDESNIIVEVNSRDNDNLYEINISGTVTETGNTFEVSEIFKVVA